MHLTLTTDGPIDLVAVEADRIDAAGAVAFKDAFRRIVGTGDRPVVLDLARVAFIDSSGLGAIVAAHKMLAGTRTLELAGLQEPVAKVMALTRLDTVFRIHGDAAAARADHQSPAA